VKSYLTILGCGSSMGVPRADGFWGSCDKKNKKNYRTRCSALISKGNNNILIDSSPDLRFQLLKNKVQNITVKKINTSLYDQQILSFIASAINHVPIRQKILEDLQATDLLNNLHRNLINDIKSDDNLDLQTDVLVNKFKNSDHAGLIISCLNSEIYQLFPYSHSKFDPQLAYQEVLKSLKNLNTRLLNLKKINKSLDNFVNDSNALNWSELQNINFEILDKD